VTKNARAKARRLRVIDGSGGDSSRPKPKAATAEEPSALPAPHELPSKPPSVGHQTLAELPDETLVALSAQGDVRAFERLYRRYAGFAFNLAVRISGTTEDVEDTVHDAFLRAFGSLAELRNPGAFRNWLGSIVVNAMRSRLRRARLQRLVGLGRAHDPVDLESIASSSAPPGARAEIAQIYALLRTLPVNDRIAWTLRFVEGHDLKSAAELAGCSLATVKRRIRRAQSFLETTFVDTSHKDAQP